MKHLHITIEKSLFERLRRIHPRYGEISRVIRKLLLKYVKQKEGSNAS